MHTEYTTPSTLVQEKSLSGTALDSVMAAFADYEGPLTTYERACLADAPWGDGEVEPRDEDDGHVWAWEAFIDDTIHKYDEIVSQYGDARNQAHIASWASYQDLEEARALYAEKSPQVLEITHYQKKPIPVQLRWAVFRRDDYRCVICGCDEDLTADHIVSEFNGGKASIGNLQTLCRPCNSRKGAR